MNISFKHIEEHCKTIGDILDLIDSDYKQMSMEEYLNG